MMETKIQTGLVIKGLQQKINRVESSEIFSPGVKVTTIMLDLSIMGTKDLDLQQIDKNTYFLHSDLEKDIYIAYHGGFHIAGKANMVFKFNKRL